MLPLLGKLAVFNAAMLVAYLLIIFIFRLSHVVADLEGASGWMLAALLILGKLEENDIVGAVATVNVANLYNLELQYGQRYQVKLGDTSNMDRKISEMKASVMQLNDYQTGILDVSYTTYAEGPFYTPLA